MELNAKNKLTRSLGDSTAEREDLSEAVSEYAQNALYFNY